MEDYQKRGAIGRLNDNDDAERAKIKELMEQEGASIIVFNNPEQESTFYEPVFKLALQSSME